MGKDLKEGQKAPDFAMPTDGGGRVELKKLKGRKVVLYFYPKAMTPGCTVEANDFTKLAKSFEKAGAVVIGVSKDPVQRLDTFKEKEGLSVILASDEDVTIAKAYGVWGEKSLYGRKFMGIERATFLIDGAGVVRRLWRKVKVKGHAEEVLQAVRTP